VGRFPKWLVVCLILAGLVVFAPPGLALSFNVNITVDENGHGTLTNSSSYFANLPFAMLPDPGPGGLASVLTYDLLSPPGLVAGDVLLHEGGIGGPVLDVIRFNPTGGTTGNGGLDFYSDNLDGFDSLADTFGPPGGYYPNVIDLIEVGSEGANYAYYTPLAGQPGFVTGAAGPVHYLFFSDVPEPGSMMLLGSGAALFGLCRIVLRRRNSRA